MPNTYTQLFVQIVFAVKYRARLIAPHWKDDLERYISGIVQTKGHKLIRICCMPDHAHIFIGMRPHEALSNLVRDIKKDSTNFVNAPGLTFGRFAWQEGFGAFSYAQSDVDRVVWYIMNQQAHHRKATFREEFEMFLREHEIKFDPKYVVNDPEE